MSDVQIRVDDPTPVEFSEEHARHRARLNESLRESNEALRRISPESDPLIREMTSSSLMPTSPISTRWLTGTPPE
jgi:hypothetical protein